MEALTRPCPHCDANTLVQDVVFADRPEIHDMWYCFRCTTRHTSRELVPCAGCSRPWPSTVEGSIATLCPDCREQTEPEDVA